MSNMNGKRKEVDVREPDSKIRKVDDVKQRRSMIVELRPENERFSRLLELLKEEKQAWYDDDDENKRAKILIFVKSDEECDALSSDLLKHRYPSLSLHDIDDDGESTISDFKNSSRSNLLIATSVAARSLKGVKDVLLVVNFQLPILFDDYAYRSGHTGSNGCSVTFLSAGHDEVYAPLLSLDLNHSNQVIPDDLLALVESFAVRWEKKLYEQTPV